MKAYVILLFKETFDLDLHKKYRQSWQSVGRMHSNVTHQGMTKIKKKTIILANLFFITRWGEKKKEETSQEEEFSSRRVLLVSGVSARDGRQCNCTLLLMKLLGYLQWLKK